MGQVFNIDIFANQTSIKIDLLQYVNFDILIIFVPALVHAEEFFFQVLKQFLTLELLINSSLVS